MLLFTSRAIWKVGFNIFDRPSTSFYHRGVNSVGIHLRILDVYRTNIRIILKSLNEILNKREIILEYKERIPLF